MRIVLSCLQDAQRHPVPAYDFWARYFTHGLEEAGHEVVVIPGVDWAEALRYEEGEALQAWRARAWPVTVDFITREHRRQPVDLFLGYLFPAHVDSGAIESIRTIGVPTVNFFCDNVRWFTAPPAAYKAFDIHWVPEKKALATYRAAGMRVVHAPMPCWVAPELRDPDSPERLPPTFVGSRDPVREELFAGALKLGAEFDIRGAGWTATSSQAKPNRSISRTMRNQIAFIRSQGLLPWLRKLSAMTRPRPDPTKFAGAIREAPGADEYEAVLREAMIAIGVNRYPSFRHAASRPDSYSRLRDIEGPMLGACYLTEWTEGLDDLYDLGTEIETYGTAEELAGKIEALRGDASRRRSLRRRGQRRAQSDHTVGRSISRIALELGL